MLPSNIEFGPTKNSPLSVIDAENDAELILLPPATQPIIASPGISYKPAPLPLNTPPLTI